MEPSAALDLREVAEGCWWVSELDARCSSRLDSAVVCSAVRMGSHSKMRGCHSGCQGMTRRPCWSGDSSLLAWRFRLHKTKNSHVDELGLPAESALDWAARRRSISDY
jgi:hypothetical protein